MPQHRRSDERPPDHSPQQMEDSALLRGLTSRRMSRRDVLRYSGAGAGAVGLSALLSACGVSGTKQEKTTAKSVFEGAKKEGEVVFANWPAYIDETKKGGKKIYPSLEMFTKQTGIGVEYKTPINENETFFATIQPSLEAGKSTGYDIIVITNGPTLSKLIRLNYLVPLDQSYLDNFKAHAASAYKDPSYDPGNKYTIPWQSGITGIGYNKRLTGREITSFDDLFDPKFKGKVGMFGDTLDMPNFALAGIGVNPETSTPDDWKKARDVLVKQRDAGIVRQYYTQNYLPALANGDVWLTMAWSGDVFQEQRNDPDLEFVVPKEGGLIWTDNMCIPAKAEHPVDAITLMDFVYQPKIAGIIADWVNYITPVPAAKGYIAKTLDDKPVANSPLVFPTDKTYERTYRYRVLTQKEEEQWTALFQPVYQV
ncbi:spermidine/putrescine ABC transporter substrate-binding protein [soil metagenome]